VRSFPISGLRVFAGLAMALILSATVAYFGTPLLIVHGEMSSFLLKHTGIPVAGMTVVDIYPHLGPVVANDISFPHHRASPLRTILLFAASLAGLILVHRSVPLSRNFIIFLSILLCAAAVVIIVNPSFYFDSSVYTQIWLRGEILVWVLLPWVSAFLFVLTIPSVTSGVAWALLIQVYAIVWSAVRFVFCLGVFHYTGILFLPLLWFCLGVLFDLVYVLVFYSLALNLSIRKVTGEREL
jgi:hypothetical protein